ncbi:MAG: DNA polymerase I [Candidatus Electronema aureum]|uniref:DNA polymerase I n=1 Tax=Candidatus Electronema aureum TaxID=2005002 RepID=A0A521G2F9_9BACT|nr:MAG: DNA polymerase I [Candidatus Electronema aureum]
MYMIPSKKTVYLIDGSAYIYRAFHAVKPLHTSGGLPTHAVYGFISILRRILREKQPEYLAVAFDTKGPVFRHQISPDYKANRPAMPDDLVVQIPYIRRITEAYSILSMAADDLEADDLLASAARLLVSQGCKVIVVSGDKDLLQLVGEDITCWDPMSDKVMDTAAVEEKYGLGPSQLLDYFALIGDASDHISGVPGVGPKTAQKLIAEYRTLEGLYEQAAGLKKSKVKENLLTHREAAFLSRELVRLQEKAVVEADVEAYRVTAPDTEALRTLLTELEFTSLLKSDVPAAGLDTAGFQLITRRDALERLAAELRTAEYLVIDTETTSLDPLQAELVGLSLCTGIGQAWYLPCGHRDALGQLLPEQLHRQDILELVGPLLADDRLPKIGHNLKYDYAVLAAPQNGGLRVAGPLWDTMIGAWLLDPNRHSYKLDDLCLEQGFKLTSFAEVTEASKAADAFCRVPPEKAKDYSCEDVQGSLRLFLEQRPQLEQQGLLQLFTEVEGQLIPVLADMERSGILIDLELLGQLSDDFAAQLSLLETEIHLAAGHPFNINSPQQLAEVLFEELNLPRDRKTKTGYSTDVRVLEKLAWRHELPALIVRFRNLAKLKSTYVDKLPEHVSPISGRVHSSFNQCGTATGRLSSSNPNLQNIPIRSEEGRLIRSAFIAQPGCLLLAADYSQIDLRVLAHYSNDADLLEAFKKDEDIHARTAADIFRVSRSLITPEMRRIAKSINFGIVYGMSSFGLSEQLGISRREAQLFIDRYFEHYPGIKQFMEAVIEQARRDGYVSCLLGRRRQLPEINSSNRTRREFAERTAINTPIQGTASDIIKLAMLKAHEELKNRQFRAKLLLQIHDELVFEVPEEEIEAVSAWIVPLMESVLELAVPLRVNARAGLRLDRAY